MTKTIASKLKLMTCEGSGPLPWIGMDGTVVSRDFPDTYGRSAPSFVRDDDGLAEGALPTHRPEATLIVDAGSGSGSSLA